MRTYLKKTKFMGKPYQQLVQFDTRFFFIAPNSWSQCVHRVIPLCDTIVICDVVYSSLTPIHNCIIVSTGYGVLHRVLWDGQFDSHLTIKLKNINFSADLTPQSKGMHSVVYTIVVGVCVCVLCVYVSVCVCVCALVSVGA